MSNPLLEDVIDTLIEVGNGVKEEHLKLACFKLIQFRDNGYNEMQKAINEIAPWIAASLSDEHCREYGLVAENLLSFAEVEDNKVEDKDSYEILMCRYCDDEICDGDGMCGCF